MGEFEVLPFAVFSVSFENLDEFLFL